MSALSCVTSNDVMALRTICTVEPNPQYNIEEVDMYGNTALLKSCYLGRLECARTLLEFGANIYAVNYFGQNALTLASYAGNLQLVLELLLRRPYQDFNLSSLIPAVCVAAMRQHKVLVEYFMTIDPIGTPNLRTVHGLGINELSQILKPRNFLQNKLVNKYH
ncbi:DNA replication inhibitor plutonium [Drosophila navojoa]|uniref:DNA replication inhibitor plutonium n=1 Tax=Drosophila navojoa TaxID=7232 RepID=UPI000847AAB5|nr:DNA replication inhibitor plutonium [Drosophila navojoa]